MGEGSDDPETLRRKKLPVYAAMGFDKRMFKIIYYEYILKERK